MSSVCLSEAGLCHGTAVAVAGRGALIIGSSGSGKSTLALQMLAFGGGLVADDQVLISALGDALVMRAPAAIQGMIEARGVGLLTAPMVAQVPLAVVVDLDRPEPDRLPPWRKIDVAGRSFPLILGAGQDHLAPALMITLRHGRAQ